MNSIIVRELTAPAPRVRLEERAVGDTPREAKEIGKNLNFKANFEISAFTYFSFLLKNIGCFRGRRESNRVFF